MTKKIGTVVAIDVGEVRIGVALASLASRLPQAWGVIERSEKVADVLESILVENNTIAVVVGLPRGLQGQDTAQTKLVKTFADNLKQQIKLPFYYQDEALSSKRAEQVLKNRKTQYNKGDVDALAATYILDDFLLSGEIARI